MIVEFCDSRASACAAWAVTLPAGPNHLGRWTPGARSTRLGPTTRVCMNTRHDRNAHTTLWLCSERRTSYSFLTPPLMLPMSRV